MMGMMCVGEGVGALMGCSFENGRSWHEVD